MAHHLMQYNVISSREKKQIWRYRQLVPLHKIVHELKYSLLWLLAFLELLPLCHYFFLTFKYLLWD